MLNKKDYKRFQNLDLDIKAKTLYEYLYCGHTQRETSELVKGNDSFNNFDVSIILRGYGFQGMNNGCLADFELSLDDFNIFVSQNPDEIMSKDLFMGRLKVYLIKKKSVQDLNKIIKGTSEQRIDINKTKFLSFLEKFRKEK